MQQTIEELILKEIGGEALAGEQKQGMLDDIAESVQNYFIAYCYQKLSEVDKEQLEKLIDAGDDLAQDDFLKSKLANHASILQQAVDQTVRDIKESQAELDQELKDLDPQPASAAPLNSLPVGQPVVSPVAMLQPIAPAAAPPTLDTAAAQPPSNSAPAPQVQ